MDKSRGVRTGNKEEKGDMWEGGGGVNRRIAEERGTGGKEMYVQRNIQKESTGREREKERESALKESGSFECMTSFNH